MQKIELWIGSGFAKKFFSYLTIAKIWFFLVRLPKNCIFHYAVKTFLESDCSNFSLLKTPAKSCSKKHIQFYAASPNLLHTCTGRPNSALYCAQSIALGYYLLPTNEDRPNLRSPRSAGVARHKSPLFQGKLCGGLVAFSERCGPEDVLKFGWLFAVAKLNLSYRNFCFRFLNIP